LPAAPALPLPAAAALPLPVIAEPLALPATEPVVVVVVAAAAAESSASPPPWAPEAHAALRHGRDGGM
jgi:hypothetical protein